MEFIRRRAVAIFVFMLITAGPTTVFAQNTVGVTVSGSGIVAPLFTALAQGSGVDANVDLSVTGTRTGFEQLCSGASDIALATRPLSVAEEALCREAGVNFHEFLVGHNILTFVADPQAEIEPCLTGADINTIFAPSAEGAITNWNQVRESNPDRALTLIVPPSDTAPFALLDALVEGAGLRDDVRSGDDDAAVIAAVGGTEGALGVVTLGAAAAAGDTVRILNLNTVGRGCVAPSAGNVEGRLYTAAERLLFYVRADALSEPGVAELLDFAFGAGAELVEQAGFVMPTGAAYETDRMILANAETGRRFSRELIAFEIPENLAGQLRIGGAGLGRSYIEGAVNAFTSGHLGVTADVALLGEPAGFRQLCNGELDIVIAFRDLPAEQAETCEANNVALDTLALGSGAVALLANTGHEFLSCLTTGQLATVWRAESTGAVDNWNQVDVRFDAVPLTLIGPGSASALTDLLLLQAAGAALPRRNDIELESEALLRATVAAEREGGLTYVNWRDSQVILSGDFAAVQAVAVDAGDGCVAPTLENIETGRYPLARSARLFINRASLAQIAVQSFLWDLMSDARYDALENANLVGVQFSELPAVRDGLQDLFALAEQAAAAAALETPIPDEGAATPEVEPTAAESGAADEATATSEAEPTEFAPEPTVESSPTVAASPTPAPTETPAAQPPATATLEPVATATPEPAATATATTQPTTGSDLFPIATPGGGLFGGG